MIMSYSLVVGPYPPIVGVGVSLCAFCHSSGEFIPCVSTFEFHYTLTSASAQDHVILLGFLNFSSTIASELLAPNTECVIVAKLLISPLAVFLPPEARATQNLTLTRPPGQEGSLLLVALECDSRVPFQAISYQINILNTEPSWAMNISCDAAPLLFIGVAGLLVSAGLLLFQISFVSKLELPWSRTLPPYIPLARTTLILLSIVLLLIGLGVWSGYGEVIYVLFWIAFGILVLSFVVQLFLVSLAAAGWYQTTSHLPPYLYIVLVLVLLVLTEIIGTLHLPSRIVSFTDAVTFLILTPVFALWLTLLLIFVFIVLAVSKPCLGTPSIRWSITFLILLLSPILIWDISILVGTLVPDTYAITVDLVIILGLGFFDLIIFTVLVGPTHVNKVLHTGDVLSTEIAYL